MSCKRIFDIFLVAIAFATLWPLFLAVSLVILISIGKPLFFKQLRPGLNGQPFIMYKFRTMTMPVSSSENDSRDELRMTRAGSLLRSLSLDELPELWNVLKGDMSLVGPRPLLMEYLPLYNAEQARRHDVRPGVTGWAQVNGRNAIDWDQKFRLDVWYVQNQSLLLDIKILWLTAWKVFIRDGISAKDEVTMPKFTGNKPEEKQP